MPEGADMPITGEVLDESGVPLKERLTLLAEANPRSIHYAEVVSHVINVCCFNHRISYSHDRMI